MIACADKVIELIFMFGSYPKRLISICISSKGTTNGSVYPRCFNAYATTMMAANLKEVSNILNIWREPRVKYVLFILPVSHHKMYLVIAVSFLHHRAHANDVALFRHSGELHHF